jgi:hypothetical protein
MHDAGMRAGGNQNAFTYLCIHGGCVEDRSMYLYLHTMEI